MLEQLRNCCVQPMPRGLGVDLRISRLVTDSAQQACALGASAVQRSPQGGGVGYPQQKLERLDERLIGRVDRRVSASIEDGRPALRRTERDLTHQPRLSGARLTADKCDAPASVLGSSQQLVERRELSRTADERRRGLERERTGEP